MAKTNRRYMQLAAALYGNAAPPAPKKTPRVTATIPTEEVEQIQFVYWLHAKEIRHYSIPNGRNTVGENLRYKRMGQNAGVPDICVPIPSGPYHSLYIELKRTHGGVVRDNQKEWLQWLNSQGHKAVVARGFEEAKKVVEEYLKC